MHIDFCGEILENLLFVRPFAYAVPRIWREYKFSFTWKIKIKYKTENKTTLKDNSMKEAAERIMITYLLY